MIYVLGEAAGRAVRIEAPICVVGAGVAGLLTAVEASRAGRRVVVLESGSFKPDPGLDMLNEVDQDEAVYQTSVSGRVRSLGGTSTVWGGRMLPLTANDLGPREYLGLAGWPISKRELDVHLPKIERLFGLDHSSFEHLDGLTDLPAQSGDMAARWAKWPSFKRRNIAHLLRPMLRTRAGLDVWLGATVSDFELDDSSGRLAAVTARDRAGRSLTVVAEDFVFACGTLETTRLLLWLDRCGRARVFDGCAALGRYFHDHLALEIGRLQVLDAIRTNRIFGYHIARSTRRSLHLETSPEAQRDDKAASGFVTVRPEFGSGSLQSYARRLGRAAQDGRWREAIPRLDVMQDVRGLIPGALWTLRQRQLYFGPSTQLFLDARVEQVPNVQSRLSLSQNPDVFGMARLRMNWLRTADDEHTLRSVVKRAKRFWRQAALIDAVRVHWLCDTRGPDDRLSEETRDTRHPAGTVRMGTERRSSVVDLDLRCHAVPNLFVVSAAVFPSSGSANPTLTLMQLALRTGTKLALR